MKACQLTRTKSTFPEMFFNFFQPQNTESAPPTDVRTVDLACGRGRQRGRTSTFAGGRSAGQERDTSAQTSILHRHLQPRERAVRR